ncbi:antibiotic biosynthesis monooxygenase [Aliarcobacter cryaerophilus]|uniref:antibiotic biosynthesis monooxygenase n=1 Tax=Aliarcobacter cryaerophilus TaxID=28198 RepID=UPI00082597E7|nr:antibiotic biosynthesis monooxygenase [Aliarcobacter cryaerophilus]
MHIVLRKFKVEKGFLKKLSEKFLNDSDIQKADGFIKMEFFSNEKKVDFDTGILKIYWESKDSFSKWKKSPDHVEGHKDNKGLPKEVVDITIESYEFVAERIKG